MRLIDADELIAKVAKNENGDPYMACFTRLVELLVMDIPVIHCSSCPCKQGE